MSEYHPLFDTDYPLKTFIFIITIFALSSGWWVHRNYRSHSTSPKTPAKAPAKPKNYGTEKRRERRSGNWQTPGSPGKNVRSKTTRCPSIFRRFKDAISWNGGDGRGLWKEYSAEPILHESTMRALLKVEGDLLRVVFPEDNVSAKFKHPRSQVTTSKLPPKSSPATQSDIGYEHKVFGPSIAQEKADASAVCSVKILTVKSRDPLTYIKSHDTEDKIPELVVVDELVS
ncbi:uncharacterized protein Bfra_005483 [Botrytis fragariae]|uniref:Uncharacterized protein n=1 Tax=Botrytis fragariae TaxID=1964551 RepID=A0A8H6AUL0_9HELO|nr:uncharacterized protein Bfra_005483 [Botrytis fragariae]KAF5874016.1 hypothetical protein Bfra_005483 [Botrytis fragariae]